MNKYLKFIKNGIQNVGLKKKVDFLICGTQKGGTSALHKYMSMHDELGMAMFKEVHFFDKDHLFFGNKSFYPYYHSFFNFKSKGKIFGEATPGYMYWKDAPLRIWKYNPQMKLIMILRNPIKRAYSQWNKIRDKGLTDHSFSNALKNDNKAKPGYIRRGFYVEQISRIWNYFPKEQTLIIKNESLRNEPLETLNKIYKFLNVSLISEIEHLDVQSRKYPIKMSQEEKKYLINIYKEEIKNLEKLLGWDCSDWLEV